MNLPRNLTISADGETREYMLKSDCEWGKNRVTEHTNARIAMMARVDAYRELAKDAMQAASKHASFARGGETLNEDDEADFEALYDRLAELEEGAK